MAVSFTEHRRYKCMECQEVSGEPGDGPLYECGDCGTKFTRNTSADGSSHRCPDCNRFSSRAADLSCGECEEGEVEEVVILECDVCGDEVAEDDEAEHAFEHQEEVGE